MKVKNAAIGFAITAAALYAVNVPLSKRSIAGVELTMMAAFLYLGAGIGLLVYSGIGAFAGKQTIKEPFTRKELPYTIAMVVLDIAAPMHSIRSLRFFGVALATVLMVKDTAVLEAKGDS